MMFVVVSHMIRYQLDQGFFVSNKEMELLFGVSCVDVVSRIVCSVYTNLFVFLVLLCVVTFQ